MSNDRYRPRSFAYDDELFGRQPKIRWTPTDDLAEDELDQQLAAEMQHDVAFQIREQLAKSTRFFSAADYARHVGVQPRRMTALLRGEIVMRLEDIASARRVLGIARGE